MKTYLLVVVWVCATAMFVSAETQSTTPPSSSNQQTPPTANSNTDTLTNADVIELSGLGLPDDIVVAKIHAAKAADFDTSISGLKSLKTAKVSDDVIRAMINSPRATPQPSANRTEQDKPADIPKKQCLIVAPRPWLKWEVRDSFNLKPDQLMEFYKEKDLTVLLKQGVRVLKIDPAGHQLEDAQATCKEFIK